MVVEWMTPQDLASLLRDAAEQISKLPPVEEVPSRDRDLFRNKNGERYRTTAKEILTMAEHVLAASDMLEGLDNVMGEITKSQEGHQHDWADLEYLRVKVASKAAKRTKGRKQASRGRSRTAFRVGQTVRFGRTNGEQSLGKVVKVNAKSLKVELLEPRGTHRTYEVGGIWRVPPELCTAIGRSR
tara:strand:- start:409 stop:963 length:555 start_codon:yes stop_codon:yes gene_type:complete